MIDLTGQRFGKLKVIELAAKDKRGECKWLCKCDCGNTKVVYGYHLRKGHTVSCGCHMLVTHKTHGESKTRLYKIWLKMRDRCSNPKSENYKYYGGQGVTICKEWADYEAFKIWALNNGYSNELTIDRIDPCGNYEPSNCRWVTMTEQLKNKRNTVLLTHNGHTDTLRGWSKILNIPKSTLQQRYRKGVDIFG